jgi:hypothetical protein
VGSSRLELDGEYEDTRDFTRFGLLCSVIPYVMCLVVLYCVFEVHVEIGLFCWGPCRPYISLWVLTVLTTKIRPSKSRVREEHMGSFMHIFSTNKVPRVVL